MYKLIHMCHPRLHWRTGIIPCSGRETLLLKTTTTKKWTVFGSSREIAGRGGIIHTMGRMSLYTAPFSITSLMNVGTTFRNVIL